LIRKLIHDCDGGSLLEFTMVFPIVMMVVLGTVDATYMLHEWNQASKAAYRGARQAVVSAPAVPAVAAPAYNPLFTGQDCYDPTTGTSTGACPTIDQSCTGVACDATALAPILAAMQTAFPRVQAANVQIRYQTNGLGFNGQPGGLPMSVTVSIACMNHQMFFIGNWMGWLLPAVDGCQPAQTVPIPAFSSTLPSEDMETN